MDVAITYEVRDGLCFCTVNCEVHMLIEPLREQNTYKKYMSYGGCKQIAQLRGRSLFAVDRREEETRSPMERRIRRKAEEAKSPRTKYPNAGPVQFRSRYNQFDPIQPK